MTSSTWANRRNLGRSLAVTAGVAALALAGLAGPAAAKPFDDEAFDRCVLGELDKNPATDIDVLTEVCCIEAGGTPTSTGTGQPGSVRCPAAEVKSPSGQTPGTKVPPPVQQAPQNGQGPTATKPSPGVPTVSRPPASR